MWRLLFFRPFRRSMASTVLKDSTRKYNAKYITLILIDRKFCQPWLTSRGTT